MRIQRASRPAFTIVEMLVATALILFLMAIIAQAFGAAAKTFNALRTAGDLQEKLRGASGTIRRDLAAEHFDGPFIPGRSGPRLGDQRLDQSGWVPPSGGYVMIRQFNASIPEPMSVPVNDPEGLSSTRAYDHFLQFTVKLPDLPASELFCAEFPARLTTPPFTPLAEDSRINAFPVAGQARVYSRWAEVQYFLHPGGAVTTGTNNGPSLNLYSLRRRVRLLAPKQVNFEVPAGTFAGLQLNQKYPDVAVHPAALPSQIPGNEVIRIYGPEDVTNPSNRLFFPPLVSRKVNSAGALYETGDDILLTDVISFEVKAAWFNNTTFDLTTGNSSPPAPTVTAVPTPNLDHPFADIPFVALHTVPPPAPSGIYSNQRAFDTWYRPFSDAIDWDRASTQADITGRVGFLSPKADQAPLRINIRSIQIKLRIWDAKSEQSRQVTITQEV